MEGNSRAPLVFVVLQFPKMADSRSYLSVAHIDKPWGTLYEEDSQLDLRKQRPCCLDLVESAMEL